MQLICLNTWGGRAYDAMAEFVLQQREGTDIFCFQEILVGGQSDDAKPDAPRPGLYGDLKRLLPDFEAIFTPMKRRTYRGPGAHEYGLATFAKRSIELAEVGHVPLLPSDPGPRYTWEGWENMPERPLQTWCLVVGGRPLYVANFHGTPDPPDKRDTPERLEQSRRILEVLSGSDHEVILAGDFNLLPETESIEMLDRRFRNLVGEFAVPTTRSRLNPYRGTPREQKHADYVFVTRGVQVERFEVPDVAVSDHLPLILSFSDR